LLTFISGKSIVDISIQYRLIKTGRFNDETISDLCDSLIELFAYILFPTITVTMRGYQIHSLILYCMNFYDVL